MNDRADRLTGRTTVYLQRLMWICPGHTQVNDRVDRLAGRTTVYLQRFMWICPGHTQVNDRVDRLAGRATVTNGSHLESEVLKNSRHNPGLCIGRHSDDTLITSIGHYTMSIYCWTRHPRLDILDDFLHRLLQVINLDGRN